jgi:hypothetical protein
MRRDLAVRKNAELQADDYEKTPNCKQMIMQLERNEALVTWLQPNSGGISDQFPVIRIRDHYYT